MKESEKKRLKAEVLREVAEAFSKGRGSMQALLGTFDSAMAQGYMLGRALKLEADANELKENGE